MNHEEILAHIDGKVQSLLEADRTANNGELTAKGEAI